MRSLLRQLPYPVRMRGKLFIRWISDLTSLTLLNMASGKNIYFKPIDCFSLQQPVRKSYLYENKLHNLRLAADGISQIVVEPGQVFSFWKAVGSPTVQRGYKKGRNLVNGVLAEEVGGGLCQVAGIIYHTAIQSNLQILERHHHSLDIYEEAERFCPLGADATVVYGYKDLRFKNTYSFQIRLIIEVNEEVITCKLMAAGKLERRDIQFMIINEPSKRVVSTIDKSTGRILHQGTYHCHKKI